MLKKFIENLANNKEIYFNVKVIPGAPKTEIRGEMADGTIKIALAAKAEKGEANRELVNYLAKALGVRKYQVKIVSGLTEKHKLIRVGR
ncbi:DUF167 domain-containing protein [Candidatus Falkowbacteria bacterium]|jgi:uncharacterized protein (TIGR00251 family)|nr:DUF167 domain-containing protein [Candidatus Falkowbacteria bacterium]